MLFEYDSSYAIVLNKLYVVGASIAIMALQLKVANFALQDLGRLAGLCTNLPRTSGPIQKQTLLQAGGTSTDLLVHT